MSYVAINVLQVPEDAGRVLEERFAARQGAVDRAPGFEHFELLRPLEGTRDYLVYTRWRSVEDFTAWRESQSFGQGHAQASERPEGARPAATGSTVWAFEVAQSSGSSSPASRGAPGGVSTGGLSTGTRPREDAPGVGSTGSRPREDVPGVVSTDPGPRQAPGQGERTPEEVGSRPPEHPGGEPGFA